MKNLTIAACVAALAFTLGGCGADSTSETTPATATGTSATEEALTVHDGWAKAADEGMTAAFGTLKNSGSKDLVVTGGKSDAAGMIETHVMVKDDSGQMVMTKTEDGFTVPAGGEFVLKPGGPHLMLMKLKHELKPGEEVVITVSDSSGGTYPLTFQVREFDGADESYDPDASSSSMSH